MKVIVDGKVYDSEHTPIVLAWDTDAERQTTANQLYNMEVRDSWRMYTSFPAGMNGLKILDEAKELFIKSQQEPIQMMW